MADEILVFGRDAGPRVLMPWDHLARRLARDHPVLFVLDPVRGFPGRTPARRDSGLTILSPSELPLQRLPGVARLNRVFLRRAIARHLGPGRPLFSLSVPHGPEVYPGLCGERVVVFHATDDFSERADGAPDEVYLGKEARLLARARLAVGVSARLAARLAGPGRRTEVLGNGYDEEVWRPGRSAAAPPSVAALPRPRHVFAGTIRAGRLDLGLVAALADARPAESFVLVGEAIPPDDPALLSLAARPNVRLLPPVPPDLVPDYVAAGDTALLPYRSSLLNRMSSPLKAFEALGLGVPVVTTPVEDLDGRPGVHAAPPERDAFLAALDRAAAESRDPGAARRRAEGVADRTWSRQAERLLGFVRECESSGPLVQPR